LEDAREQLPFAYESVPRAGQAARGARRAPRLVPPRPEHLRRLRGHARGAPHRLRSGAVSPRATAARTIARDSRGAIMVMGVFMCCIIVAAMWYLAGVGDSLVFRERAQEAADASAFGAAALHA